VIFRRHHRQAASYRHVTKNTSRQLLWNLHLRDRDARNPFRIRSYENCRVSIQHSHPVPLSPIFRIFFQVPYPATPLFATLAKTAGVCTNNSHSGTHQSRVQFDPYPPFPTPYPLSSHTLAHSFALFCTQQELNSFLFRRFRTLCSKYPGVGYPSSSFHVAKRRRIRGRMILWPSD
jgi:hypothetical protein